MRYFTVQEFNCKCGCGGGEKIDSLLLYLLSKARELANVPFVITSGYRCEEYNKKVGGVGESAHTKGLAVDIAVVSGSARFAILQAAIIVGFTRIGIGKGFIHLDVDEKKPQRMAWMYD